jgi:hypothetical protein
MSTYDPFTPPSSDIGAGPEGAIPARPTGAPKVFGILSIIFASVMLLYSLLKMLAGGMVGAVGSIRPPADDPQFADVQNMFEGMARVYRALAWEGTLVAILSALLLAIGIGQVRYREWARRWTMYWSYAAIAAVVVMVLISVMVIGPAYAHMMDQIARMGPAKETAAFSGFGSMFGRTSAVVTVMFYTPYPVLLAVFFSRPHIRAAMTR